MSWMLTGYSNCGCQEFIIPEKDNTNHAVILDHNFLGTVEDIELRFEKIDDVWRFTGTSDNCILSGNGIQIGKLIRSGDVINLSDGTENIVLMAIEFDINISEMKKYSITGSTTISIGTEADNDITVNDVPLISRHHASLIVSERNCVVIDKSKNGTFVNGKRIQNQTNLKYGDCISIFGIQVIWLGNVIAVGSKCGKVLCRLPKLLIPDSAEIKDLEKTCTVERNYFRRSPRNLPRFYAEKIEIEAPPQAHKAVRRPLLLTIGPSLTMTLPMTVGTGMAFFGSQTSGSSSGTYMYTGIIIAVLSAIIGTVWALVNLNYSKKQEIEGEQLRTTKYKDYLARMEQEISEKYTYNTQNLGYIYPSANKCAHYDEATPELWNRNMGHDDFLFLRLGTGSLPFQCPIVIPQQKFSLIEDELLSKPSELENRFKQLKNVPVGIDLEGKSLIGVIGHDQRETAVIFRNLAVQAAANICYTDLKMVFLFDGDTPSNLAAWEFARWLPHVWSQNRKIRYFAVNEKERSEVCFNLANILRLRAEEAESSARKSRKKPHYIVFVSTPDLLEGMPVAKYLLGYDKDLGATTVLFANRFEQLPNSCVDIIENDHVFSGVFSIGNDSETRVHIDFDTVDTQIVEQFARSISGIEVQEAESGGEIPDSLSFLDMYQVSSLRELNITERWIKNRTYETLRVPIGQKAGGGIVNLDIHENYHGPHGLVAGTTGSGKSEALQTYILSLATNFSPDDIAFFIIDFKGGGMANLFSNLPHMAGCISNLSGNQVHRAMVSIKSENRRRQRVFGELRVNHIDQYTQLFKRGETDIPIPHLFIVIDEFAELKRDEPDFMKELISVAQVGRSLGVHLILATQKPSGTVDENILSNTRFKLCLRVQDKQDSNDVLHKPDAAYLTQAGRCYMQVGNDEIYELFQSGWSGAVYYDDPSEREAEIAHILSNTGQPAITGISRKQRDVRSKTKETTQLVALVNHIAETADKMYKNRQRFQLWKPILPKEIHLFDILKEQSFDGEAWPVLSNNFSLSAPIGMYDDPANQSQDPLFIDLAANGHLAVCGSVVSGKSTFVQTLLFAFAQKYSPEYLNIYILDYSNHMLAPFSDLPHVGDVVYDTQLDKAEKLFAFISNLIEERKNILQGGSYAQYVKSSGRSIPYILVVIDNYASFREKTENKFESNLLTLSREGMNYGIYLIVTAGGFGAGELQNRIADNFRSVVCLEMGDRFKYSEVLRTNRFDVLPERDTKGRGLVNVGGKILEFQTALALEAADDYQRAEKMRVCFTEMSRVWGGARARRIPTIPENPTWDDFLQYSMEASSLASPNMLPFAWHAKDATIAGFDLSKTYCWLITGKTRTGKTTLLKVIATSAALSDSERFIVDFSGSKLRRFATENRAVYVSDANELFEVLKGLLLMFKERNAKKQEMLAAGLDESEIYEQMKTFRPIFLFIDNLDDFMKIIYMPPEGIGAMSGFIENITEKGYLHNIYIIAGYDYSSATFSVGRKAFVNFSSYKAGIHLGGNAASQHIFDFSTMPYSEQSKATKPGLGLIPPDVYNPTARSVIIPFLKG